MRRAILLSIVILFFISVVNAQETESTECTSNDLVRSQLVTGINTQVTSKTPVQLFSQPSVDADLIAQLPTGTLIYLASGPQCRNGNIWWAGEFKLETVAQTSNFGWITEFREATRQLSPQIPTLNPTLPIQASPIRSNNLTQLKPQGVMGPLGDVLQFSWSSNSAYLAINTLHAVWIYEVNTTVPNRVPTHLPPAAMTFWNEIGAVAFAPDNKTIATVGVPNGDFHLWSLGGKEEKVLLTQVSDYAGVAAIAPDLSKWATAQGDGTIIIWDGKTGARLQMLRGHTIVGALAFSKDGDYLLSMGGFPYTGDSIKDNTFRFWDVATGKVLATEEINKPPSGVTGEKSRIAISQDGKTAAIFAFLEKQNDQYPSRIYVLDIPSISIRNTFTVNEAIGNVTFDRQDNFLAVNALSSVIFLNPKNGHPVTQLPFTQNIQEVSLSPDNKWLVIAREADNFNKSMIEFWGVA